MKSEQLSPESAEAVHKQKNAAQAIEMAREAQLAEAIRKSAEATREATIEALKAVFGESDSENPKEMKVLIRRIPILCTNIDNMHKAIEDMRDDSRWSKRAIIGGVIALGFAVITKML